MRKALREKLKIQEHERIIRARLETFEESGGYRTQGEGWALERMGLPKVWGRKEKRMGTMPNLEVRVLGRCQARLEGNNTGRSEVW